MSTGATRYDVAVAALNLLETFLRNPSTRVAPKQLSGLITEVYDTAIACAEGGGAPALPAPGGRRALPAPKAANAPAPAPAGRELAGVPAFGVPAAYADAEGNWDPAKVWPGVEPERRDRFQRLAHEHNLARDARGIPMPRRPREMLISPDTMTVADPFTGEYFAMLKRRLETSYGLTHLDVLDMFDLTDLELPRSGPGFTASKSQAAIRSGLGHHRKSRGRKKASAA